MKKNYVYCLSVVALCWSSVSAYAYLLPATDKNLQPMATVSGVPGQGFINPEVFAPQKTYTLDCQCIYDVAKKQWNATDKTCLFINECLACTPNDKTCEIRYPDYGTSNIYKETYYANDPKRLKREYCYVTNSPKEICKPTAGGGKICHGDPNFKPNIVCEVKNK